MPTKTCATVILARGGSKGVPGKNLRPVGGVSLIGRAVRAGMQAASQAAVYVSTDDHGIAAQARLFGARIKPMTLARGTGIAFMMAGVALIQLSSTKAP